ncbi:energy-coupling factor ABC transporter permease [Endomicrobium proavitum]|uniref:CbiM-like Co2+ ABC transporter permease component n=1 Tax=Endomicrobium proavitum TaxID=1408281 RepID=A0A0G3WKZ8_9BACT|nr:energy-coupling factor ABC transporter permease [Endomicrobium proavitum]AKL98555.1 CbiM-like Co2+ ABC transporter permease component [Endomicrobium proavitum]
MHIPDGFLNNGLAGGLLAGAVAMLSYCFSKVLSAVTVVSKKLAGNNNATLSQSFPGLSSNAGGYFRKLALIAIWVFACQMFNITVASATSVHLLGGVFAAVLAGPFAGFVIMSSVLTVQSLFFADGGFLALGANIVNMAFVGSFLAYYVYKAVAKKNYYLGVSAACFFSVLTAAAFCLIELGFSATVSFNEAFKDMMSLHFLFAVVETILTVIMLKLFKSLGADNE